ncbi:MAG: 50S ribosomal protein L23 [Candidatus Nanoarchaeia archaeon]|nr:50S ribosomal protein L23 [Candidatus Haiyanarchaeum thermophilum]MCW1303100.1 50S ribosomal protein L23 [Candidatus Haiyanarchaeum thermophilum]MCW1303765.1 50S ribosomal protein L23 [Candidatus Haiyanarchaeum thermophilum]MCW1306620.1 50S ribosomal protein L23 [Candidatus Haiyanarchaeum thermophilum]MCW1307032.1 50S ribosomal protein L23 [Candidatus Haiyanarchaeum thermophilum]
MKALLYPLISEKSVKLIEQENTITFIVNEKANKIEIKREFERQFGVKVDEVRVCTTKHGEKKAYIRVNKAFKAREIATKLGVL